VNEPLYINFQFLDH